MAVDPQIRPSFPQQDGELALTHHGLETEPSPSLLASVVLECGGGSLLLFDEGADPFLTSQNGQLMYTHTTGDSLLIWQGKSLLEISGAEPMQIEKPEHLPNRNLWAPELHFFDGRWHLYYAADDGNNENHRMHVCRSRTEAIADGFEGHARVELPGDRWAIDLTTFEHNGKRYFVWSGWDGSGSQSQQLYIAQAASERTCASDAVCISRPEQPWEGWINEGPQAISHRGHTGLLFSAGAWWTKDYCLGLLKLNGDPLEPKSWRKEPLPLFCGASAVMNSRSVGHCSVLSADHSLYALLVYHALKTNTKSREVRVQPFEWEEGMPRFGHPLPISAKSSTELSRRSDVREKMRRVR